MLLTEREGSPAAHWPATPTLEREARYSPSTVSFIGISGSSKVTL